MSGGVITFEEFDDARKLAVIDGANALFVDAHERVVFCDTTKSDANSAVRQVGHIDRSGNYFCDI